MTEAKADRNKTDRELILDSKSTETDEVEFHQIIIKQ